MWPDQMGDPKRPDDFVMEIFIEKLLSQGSPLVVLVVVVVVFLKHIAAEGKQMRSMFEEMHNDHMTARKEVRETLEKNTSAMMENTIAMRGLSRAVEANPLKPVR